MPLNQQKQIDRLWKLQEISSKNLQYIADRMGNKATAGIVTTQEEWDKLFDSWEAANKTMQDIGSDLNKLLPSSET
ncbi:MAG TPA: hypothetical protein VMV48_13735 [Gallionellaceae bacterium]|nr:hypothetical protein [Gallionellaceae bacterium]